MTVMSTPDWRRCMAVVCRNVCGEMRRPTRLGQTLAAPPTAKRSLFSTPAPWVSAGGRLPYRTVRCGAEGSVGGDAIRGEEMTMDDPMTVLRLQERPPPLLVVHDRAGQNQTKRGIAARARVP